MTSLRQFTLDEGQVATFILREPVPEAKEAREIKDMDVDRVLNDTTEWWNS